MKRPCKVTDMIIIKCEYKLSPKCTGFRKVKKRYAPLVKNNTCRPCSLVLAQQKNNINRIIAQSSSHRPAAKEIRKPECDHYYKCYTRAAYADSHIVGCNGCDRESYTLRPQLDVFPSMNADEYHTLSPDVWRGNRGAV